MLKRYPCPIFCYRNQWSSLSISMSTKNRRYVCAHVTKMTQLIPYCSKFLRDKIFVLFVKGHLIFFTKFLPCCGCNIFYFEIIITNLIPFMKILTLENLELYGTYNIVVEGTTLSTYTRAEIRNINIIYNQTSKRTTLLGLAIVSITLLLVL